MCFGTPKLLLCFCIHYLLLFFVSLPSFVVLIFICSLCYLICLSNMALFLVFPVHLHFLCGSCLFLALDVVLSYASCGFCSQTWELQCALPTLPFPRTLSPLAAVSCAFLFLPSSMPLALSSHTPYHHSPLTIICYAPLVLHFPILQP